MRLIDKDQRKCLIVGNRKFSLFTIGDSIHLVYLPTGEIRVESYSISNTVFYLLSKEEVEDFRKFFESLGYSVRFGYLNEKTAPTKRVRFTYLGKDIQFECYLSLTSPILDEKLKFCLLRLRELGYRTIYHYKRRSNQDIIII